MRNISMFTFWKSKSALAGTLFCMSCLWACQPPPAPMVPVPDGPQWSSRTPANSLAGLGELQALCVDDTGAVWTGGTAGYLVRIAPAAGETQWPLGAAVQALAWAGRYVWAGTPEGLYRFDGQQFVVLQPLGSSAAQRDITALTTDPEGRLWVGNRAGEVAYRAGSTWTAVPLPWGSNPATGRAIRSLRVTPAGDIWAGTQGQGLWQRRALQWGRLPLAASVTALAEASLDHGWIGTAGDGLYWAGDQGLLPFGGAQGLESDSIADIQRDRRGFAWVATTRGIYVISDPATGGDLRVDRWGEAQLGQADVRCLRLLADGTVWVATRRGLWQYQP